MIRGLRPSVLLSQPLSLALCLPGVVALWLLRGEAPAPALAARAPGAAAAS
ncbi:hypothetical protein [Cystobacter fuscus]|uniref:hypothetical protein n=1 Tax=Cystobacter fuscus TaxID=43 RepID=UPI0037BE6358